MIIFLFDNVFVVGIKNTIKRKGCQSKLYYDNILCDTVFVVGIKNIVKLKGRQS